MLKPIKYALQKVQLLLILALLPSTVFANTEIIQENGQIGNRQSVIKDRQSNKIETFEAQEIQIRPFAVPKKLKGKSTIEGLPVKLVIDDVIVFRAEPNAMDNLVACSSPTADRFSSKKTRFYTPG
ncbi:MAG: hypothetical protein AAGJ18_22410 [Bacteroidota bacterium]